jgi:hypothetical protein
LNPENEYRKMPMNLTPALLALLLLAPPGAPRAPQKPKETVWHKVLRITGISAMPSTAKGPPESTDGDLWLATADGQSRLRLTRDGGYQSPIFGEGGDTVLALREGKLMRVATSGIAEPEPLFAVPGVTRLVGANREAPGQIIVLTTGGSGLGLLDLTDRKVHSLLPTASPTEVKAALAKLARWDRTWHLGDPSREVSLLVRPTGRSANVFYQTAGATPIDISHCEEDRCGQPALSADGRKVVFVRSPLSTASGGAAGESG